MLNKECKKKLDWYKVTLLQKVSYRAGSKKESYKKKIISEKREGVNKREDKQSNFMLDIPS